MNETLIYIIFAISTINTIWHLYEEHQGKLWRYFGAIAGVKISDNVGRFFFTILLGITLFSTAITGVLEINSEAISPILKSLSLGFLLGARVSDWWNSHFKLQKKYRGNRGYQGNPGYISSLSYLVEAVLLIILVFQFSSLWNPEASWLPLVGLLTGSVSGGLLFVIVIPVIKWIGKKIAPESLKEAWIPYERIPKWAE